MSIAHLLEEFGLSVDHARVTLQTAVVPADAIETARLEAYEEGYKAGWDDAIGANNAEQLQLAADLSQNLRDLTFTYQEAVSHVTKTLNGVFDEMLKHFLPEVAQMALAPKVVEVIQELPLSSETMRLTLAVHAENLLVIEKVTALVDHENIQVEEDEELTTGQVALRFGDQEVAIDFDGLLDALRDALNAALPGTQLEVSNG